MSPSRTESSSRRPNGESWKSEGPNAQGYYEAFVWMGTKADGTPDRRHVKRKSEVGRNKAVRELEKKRDAGQVAKPGRVKTVKAMLDRHLDVVLPQRERAPKTIIGYRSLCKHQIYPRWGGQRIDRLLPEQLEDGYADMRARGLAASSVRKVHAILSSAYEIEVRRGNVARNPCKLVEPPRLGQAKKNALTQEQARKVLEVVGSRRNAARWSVGLACGLRQGEALGLRWPYVNLDSGELRVWFQLQRLPWRHGCPDMAACTEPRHRRPCPRRCLKALRKSGRPHICIPANDPRLCPPGCARHAATCPDRQGGGLVFREIKERRRKTVALPPELVAVLKAQREAPGPGTRDGRQSLAGPRRGVRLRGRPSDRSVRGSARVVSHPGPGRHPARRYAHDAPLGRHHRPGRGRRPGRGSGDARPFRYPRDPWLHPRVITAGPGRGGPGRPGSVRGNCYQNCYQEP
jgi:integrase